MTDLVVSELYRYPLKSAGGEALRSAEMDSFGLARDRRWMLVDDAGVFVSQRSTPAMALLRALARDDGLHLAHDDAELLVTVPRADAPLCDVDIWGDQVAALRADASASEWVSARIGRAVHLVYLPDTARRAVDPAFASAGELVAFSDGFPLLLITQASLDSLNERLERPVPMNRFRPNIVIAGADAHAEDEWRRLRIGGAEVALVKPCSRCAVPSVDQATAERDTAINRTLASYRRRDGAIYFGMNALGAAGARFTVGDSVEVLH